MAAIIIIELEDNGVVPVHVLLVEPSVVRVVQDFVRFVVIVWEDDIGLDEIIRVHASVITKSEGRVLDGR
jgi:hypothetical protein